MVVADYSVQISEERQLQDAAIDNFCPRLCEPVRRLSQHKVGPLKQPVYLSHFQSSGTCSLPTNGDFSLRAQPLRNDIFVLTLPFLCDEMLPVSNHNNIVQWLIMTQCNNPHKAPEVILLGLDNIYPYSHTNQRHLQQIHQIIPEQYWLQFVASDSFHLPCLAKWAKINDSSFLSQFCMLADQLYDCYINFQLYKLKMSLKSVSPSSQLVQAYTQFKQLSKSAVTEIDSVTTYIALELSVNLGTTTNTLGYEHHFSPKYVHTPLVRLRAIISMNSVSTELVKNDDYKIDLVSVTANFSSNIISSGMLKKNLNKKYAVQILNPKLNHEMLNLNSIMMTDFVSFVFQVQKISIGLYNSESLTNVNIEESPDCCNLVQLVFEGLYEEFCRDIPDNYLIDYQINNNNKFLKNSFIRFLLVDNGDVISDTSQLKYILTVEFNEDLEKNENLESVPNTFQINDVTPTVTLRSVYDDESPENSLTIDIGDVTFKSDINLEQCCNRLAAFIKVMTIATIRKSRYKAVTPILTRYHSQWNPTDPYYLSTLTKPPPYRLP